MNKVKCIVPLTSISGLRFCMISLILVPNAGSPKPLPKVVVVIYQYNEDDFLILISIKLQNSISNHLNI